MWRLFRVFVVGVASRRGFVIVLSLCEDKTSFPPPLFSLWIFKLVKLQSFTSKKSSIRICRLGNWFGIVSCCLKWRTLGFDWLKLKWSVKRFALQLYFINTKKTLHTASWNLFTHLPSLSVRCSWPSTLCHSYMVFHQQRTSPPKTRILIMLWVIQYYFPFLARTEYKKGVVNCI